MKPPSTAPRKPGRPALLSESEVLTLAILARWPRFRSGRYFWRFASSHLRSFFPTRKVRCALNKALSTENNAGRLRTDWERVWRPRR